MAEAAEQCMKLPVMQFMKIFFANGSAQLCTFSPVQSFQNTVSTAEVITLNIRYDYYHKQVTSFFVMENFLYT
jgi:hypothetical protein